MFCSVFLVFIVSCIYLFYLFIHDDKLIKKALINIGKLSFTQILCIFGISISIVASSIFLFELDKNYNTPLINMIILRTTSIILTILVGIFLFEEKYTITQIIGLGVTILGVYLMTNKF